MTTDKKQYIQYRLLEILPGFLVWTTLIAAVVLSVTRPILAIYLIILFDLYWMVRVSYLMIYIIVSWKRFRIAKRIDWQAKLETITDKNWREYWHIVFVPTYKEPFEVIAAGIAAIANGTYGNKKQMIIVLAGEERDREHFLTNAATITDQYKNMFHGIITTVHPSGLPGELPGKGSNLYHAGHQAKDYIDEAGIDYNKIIVSTFDCDTVPNKQYFSYLTYHFLTHRNPYRASFQPLTFYHNNIWESDIVTRVVANSTTFWLLTDLARNDRLFTFSSHSMSWQALVDVGFWQNNIVTEDSRIFLQCLMHYNGDYEVFPMYITVSMNTVFMGSIGRSMINQYKQMRRWAYGVEHFPYMVWHFVHNKKIPLKKKITYIWNQTEGVYSWATAPMVMFIVGHLPLIIVGLNQDSSFIAQQAPLILSWIMTTALLGIILIAMLATIVLRPRPLKGINRFFQYSIMLVQWAIFPITMVLFGSIPAIDAQTRLMVGKYLDFWVTEKKHTSALPTKEPAVTS